MKKLLKDFEKREQEVDVKILRGKPGDKGEPGSSVTPEEVAKEVTIPVATILKEDEDFIELVKGESGKSGRDGKSPKIDISDITGRVLDIIPKQQVLKGEDGKDGSPDSGPQIVKKINASKSKIERKNIEGLDDEFESHRRNTDRKIQNILNIGGGSSGGGGGASPLTTKGDVYTYTTVDARLGVGVNGQVLSSDSSTATGLKWIALGGGGDMTTAVYDPANIAEQLVGLVATQTLSNKTFVAPALGTPASGVATNLTGTATALNIGGNAATVTVANEVTDATSFIGFYTAASGSLPGKTNTNMTFDASTGIATFASTVLTTTDINGGTVDGTVIGASSAAAGTFTLATAEGFAPTSSTATGNRMYLPAANTLGFAINGSGEVQLTATALSPVADGGNSLGTTALGWQNLFGNTGFVINIENSDWVATHTAGILTIGTGDLRVTNAGANTASVVTVGGTQTLTNKTLTSPTLTTPNAFTTGGTITLAENTSISLDPAGSTDGKYTGITVTATAGYTQAFGDLVTLDKDDSRWEAVDISVAAAATGDARGILGMVVVAGTDGNACTILLHGIIRADANFPALTIGAAVYASTTGDIVVTQPSTVDYVIRIVGSALTADEIYFNPDNSWITHT